MNFNIASKQIVRDSISTAICIDNTFIEPYNQNQDSISDNYQIPKKLYESFKEHNCILDIYKYSDFQNWSKKKDFILNNRDLLILDWELTDGDPRFKDSLEILLEAVKTDSLPFIYIYTQEKNLDIVISNISSYFSGTSREELKGKFDEFCDELEDFNEVEDGERLIRGLKQLCIKIIKDSDNISNIQTEINDYFEKNVETENLGGFRGNVFNLGKKIFQSNDDVTLLKTLGYFLTNGLFRGVPVNNIEIIPLEGENYAYLIHNTLVKISTKNMEIMADNISDVISPDEVYNDLSNTICRRTFLSLLGLEMRNRYRDKSSVIGKDINEIDELAFFHHQGKLIEDGKGRFHEFLRSIWKDEVSTFLQNQEPILFDVLDDYMDHNDISKKMLNFQNNTEKLYPNLAKLNYYYCILRITQRKQPYISFGDLFCINDESPSEEAKPSSEVNDTPSKEKISIKKYPFLLCITPHCDCLRPSKVNNMLYFVFGKKEVLKYCLKKGDSGFISYIKEGRDIISIEWMPTPFSLFIPTEFNNINKEINSIFSGKKIVLKYIGCQKENYTQRIANEAFSQANRIGIDFACIKSQ